MDEHRVVLHEVMARGRKAPLHESLPTRLIRARELSGMNTAELGRLARLSRTTVSNIEEGKTAPGIDTVERLAEALHVSPAWLGFGEDALVDLSAHRIAPGFDPLKLSAELAPLVNGAGGHIDQMYLYIDLAGAAQWRSLVDSYKGLPTRPLAEALVEHAERQPLDVIGLGSGIGQHEVGLVKHLLEARSKSLRLYLVDISHFLLTAAYQHAQEALEDTGVRVLTVEGDFNRLPSFMHLLGRRETGPRRRVACMFGYTFTNLGNEVLFVRNSLVGFQPGDFLVLDVTKNYAPADRPDEVRTMDPALLGQRPTEFQHKVDAFLTGPIRRHLNEQAEITITPSLDATSCPVPGSYAIEHRVTVRSPGKPERHFSVGHAKRYDTAKLADCLRKEGWALLAEFPYGEAIPCNVALFQRRG